MRLNELEISTAKHLIKNNWQIPSEIAKYLGQNGYERIGSGFHARVFSKPNTNSVIKVSMAEDLDWIQFAEFCKVNRGSPYLPKISRVIKWQPEPGQEHSPIYFIAFMEKLTSYHNVARPMQILAMDAAYLACPRSQMPSSGNPVITRANKVWPGFYDMMIKVVVAGNKHGASLDINSSNIMFRTTGKVVPVVIDPWA